MELEGPRPNIAYSSSAMTRRVSAEQIEKAFGVRLLKSRENEAGETMCICQLPGVDVLTHGPKIHWCLSTEQGDRVWERHHSLPLQLGWAYDDFNQSGMAGVMLCDFPGWVIKGQAASHLVRSLTALRPPSC